MMDDEERFETLAQAWDDFKQAFEQAFFDSGLGRFMIWLSDKLVKLLER